VHFAAHERTFLVEDKRFCMRGAGAMRGLYALVLDSISTRMLTLKLKKLEEERIVKKTKEGCYELTEKGKGLKVVERAMRSYGEKYL